MVKEKETVKANEARKSRSRKYLGKDIRFCIKFDEGEFERLTQQSAEERRPMSQIVRDAIEDYLRKQERKKRYNGKE